MIMRTAAASVALLFCAARSLGAQVTANAAVDRIFAEWDKPDSPGCAVGAIQNNRYLYKRGYGMANLDYDIPNAAEMVYSIGSDSKQFTAASVALLSMQGKLSLDDDLRKSVPELPGQPLREFADAQIFTPLGMTHTHFHDDPGHIRKQRAMRYEKEGQGASGSRTSRTSTRWALAVCTRRSTTCGSGTRTSPRIRWATTRSRPSCTHAAC